MISGTCGPRVLWSKFENYSRRLIVSKRCNLSDDPEQRGPGWTPWRPEQKMLDRWRPRDKQKGDAVTEKGCGES